ncbi:GSCOCG00008779001-RA-CDS [Cotesia congregata]|nr:GSCOCG00008779001-RA-CDS [Cotesia congregata]
MEYKRIQKLLLTEYQEFTGRVLVESPFAETTRDGQGLRQVSLGLTSSKFIIASDIIKINSEFICPSELDPAIESFELVSIYPLNYITLSIYRRKRRKTLKARFIDGQINYYELGGTEKKEYYWNLWCKHIRILLSQKDKGSSLSEPSALSSTSTSTLYVLSSSSSSSSSSSCSYSSSSYFHAQTDRKHRKHSTGIDRKSSLCRLWAQYGGAGDGNLSQWSKKDLYLGPSYTELGYGFYTPIINNETTFLRNESDSSTDLIFKTSNNTWPTKTRRKNLTKIQSFHYNDSKNGKRKTRMKKKEYKLITKSSQKVSSISNDTLVPKLSRFKFGIDENCITGLYLEPHYGDPHHLVRVKSAYKLMDPYKFIESGVIVWEKNNFNNGKKHLRRWGLVPTAHFLYALGPWAVTPGDKISIQRKRSSSAVAIRRHSNSKNDFQLQVSKKQLTSSVSLTLLTQLVPSVEINNNSISNNNSKKHFILFWTPDYWYRPKSAITSYRELQNHLINLRDYHSTKKKSNKNFFLRKNTSNSSVDSVKCDKTNCILKKIFSIKDLKNTNNYSYNNNNNNNHHKKNDSINQMRKLLKMNLKITAWDLTSSTIAQQLTLIDRDLFLRISLTEIEILITQKLSKNTPNVRAWIAFSHRVSCLVTSEIIAIKNLNMRARISTRFINAAYKCYSIGNFHSCRSILAGLQSPPIYRLKDTWSRIKTHHSTAYDTISRLSKVFKNTQSKIYERAWSKAENCPPLIPYVGYILIKILKINNYDSLDNLIKSSNKKTQTINWDGGSTFITQQQLQLDKDLNPTKIKQTADNHDYKLKSERKNIVSKILSSFIKTKNFNPIKEKRDEFYWAARQLLLARKYFNRWQTSIITAKIIAQDDQKRNLRNSHNRKNINQLLMWFENCQRHARKYDYPGHSFAWEFILKARYREDKENFFLSKLLEPALDK